MGLGCRRWHLHHTPDVTFAMASNASAGATPCARLTRHSWPDAGADCLRSRRNRPHRWGSLGPATTDAARRPRVRLQSYGPPGLCRGQTTACFGLCHFGKDPCRVPCRNRACVGVLPMANGAAELPGVCTPLAGHKHSRLRCAIRRIVVAVVIVGFLLHGDGWCDFSVLLMNVLLSMCGWV